MCFFALHQQYPPCLEKEEIQRACIPQNRNGTNSYGCVPLVGCVGSTPAGLQPLDQMHHYLVFTSPFIQQNPVVNKKVCCHS